MRNEAKMNGMKENDSFDMAAFFNTDEFPETDEIPNTDKFPAETPAMNLGEALGTHSLSLNANHFIQKKAGLHFDGKKSAQYDEEMEKLRLEEYNLKNGADLKREEIFAEMPPRQGPDWRTDIASLAVPGLSWRPKKYAEGSKKICDAVLEYAFKYPGIFQEVENVSYRTNDGILRGKVYRPENPNGKVAILFAGDCATFDSLLPAQIDNYLRNGVTVLGMNYRGLGAVYQDDFRVSHNEKSETLDDNGDVVETRRCEASICKDGEAMLDYVLDQMTVAGKRVEPENIFLHGFSMGGFVASHVAERYRRKQLQNLIREGKADHKLGGIILSSPLTSLSDAAKNFLKFGSGLVASLAPHFAGDYDTKTNLQNLCRYDREIPIYYTGGGARNLKGSPPGKMIEERDFLSPLITRIDEIPFKNKIVEIRTNEGHYPFGPLARLEKFLENGRKMSTAQYVNGDRLGDDAWAALKQKVSENVDPSRPSYDAQSAQSQYLSEVAINLLIQPKRKVELDKLKSGSQSNLSKPSIKTRVSEPVPILRKPHYRMH